MCIRVTVAIEQTSHQNDEAREMTRPQGRSPFCLFDSPSRRRGSVVHSISRNKRTPRVQCNLHDALISFAYWILGVAFGRKLPVEYRDAYSDVVCFFCAYGAGATFPGRALTSWVVVQGLARKHSVP